MLRINIACKILQKITKEVFSIGVSRCLNAINVCTCNDGVINNTGLYESKNKFYWRVVLPYLIFFHKFLDQIPCTMNIIFTRRKI